MDVSATWLFTSLIVSSAGLVLFLYGKKQARIPHLAAGLLMMGYSYFVSSLVAVIVIAVVLISLLWLVVRLGY